MIEDPNDPEVLQNLPEEEIEKVEDILGDEVKEEIEEEKVQKLRKGYGRVRVMDKNNMVCFQYDYVIKKTDIRQITDYLTDKYKDCKLEVLE